MTCSSLSKISVLHSNRRQYNNRLDIIVFAGRAEAGETALDLDPRQEQE